ncbi:DUF4123 domain-containing protein [Edaphovirga cremea]|uniref:DUF4123 domain-containing protein n=1 Tax=Edaphovirga cremea TaxID=2267246 RepID=UPI000DEFE4A2|nr:DUF4123 domain-containing protein [Edaphovirga cremea]
MPVEEEGITVMVVQQQWQELALPTPVNLFVLAEATPDNGLLAQMEFHQVAHRALWRLENQPELAQYAPYLIDMKECPAFERWFGQQAGDLAFTTLNSGLTFDPLWQHLRRCTKFADAHEDRYYFLRIGNAAMLHLYLSSITDQPQNVSRLFAEGRVNGLLFQHQATELLMYCHPLFKHDTYGKGQEEGCLLWHDLMYDRLSKGAV